jgi:tetratricopeptide (TPR) repeat protein
MTYNWRGAAFGVGLAILFSAALLLEPSGAVGTAFAQQPGTPNNLQGENDARPLEAGKPVEREMAGGQKHYYTITLEAGQYLQLIIGQKGIDVIVTLFDPEGKKLVEVDSPVGAYQPERVSIITDTPGGYRLELRPAQKDAGVGRYQAKIAELRMSTAQDQTRVMAERAFSEGMTLERQGTAESIKKALEKRELALRLFKTAGDRLGEGHALHRLGITYYLLGEHQRALDYFNQALSVRQAVGDRGGEITTLNLLGVVYKDLGENQKALDYYNQALPLSRAIGDRTEEAYLLNNLGLVLQDLGENQKALNYYNQALPLSRAVSSRRGEVAALTNLRNVYEEIGDMQRAIDYFNQSLTLSRSVGDRRVEATTLNNLGNVYYETEEKQKAMDHYNQSLALSRASGNRRGEALSLNSVGIVYQSLGDYQKTLDYFNQSLPLRRAVGDRRGEAMSLTNIGEVYQSLGDYQKAMGYYNQALPLSQAVGNRPLEVKILHGISKVEAAQDKLFDARSTIESALNIIESIRTSVISPELRSSYFEPAKIYYEFSIDLLMRLHKLRPDEGYDRAALQTAERARARSLLERLAEANLKIRTGTDPALLERERSLRQLLNAKTERQMRLLNSQHTAEQAAEVADEIKALTAQYQDVEAEIRAKSPRYAALTQPQPLNSEEIQRHALDDRTLLIEYFLGVERSYLWAPHVEQKDQGTRSTSSG